MLDLSRHTFVLSSAFAAAFSFGGKMAVPAAFAQLPGARVKGFHKYKVGSVEVTALYDGMWAKPHDPAFIKNASVEETKVALGNSMSAERCSEGVGSAAQVSPPTACLSTLAHDASSFWLR